MLIKIDKKIKLDLEQFLHVWFNALPENHARIRIHVGQQKIIFPITHHLVTSECAFFSEPSGGKMVASIPITSSNVLLPARVYNGDTIIFTLDWSNF